MSDDSDDTDDTDDSDRLSLASTPIILMYHGVADVPDDPNRLFVTPRRFAEQMAWLERHGMRGVAIATLVDAVRAGRARGLVGITFDDGYTSPLETAVPVLRRHGFTATMFVLSGRLGGTNDWDPGPGWPLVSADQVGELVAAGMEIGSHGVTHVRLAGADAVLLKNEVDGSRACLGELLGGPVRGFAYPYGFMDTAARRAVRDAGYDYACAVQTPIADLGLMALPRISLTQRDGASRMAVKRLFFAGYTAANGTRHQLTANARARAAKRRLTALALTKRSRQGGKAHSRTDDGAA